VVQGDLQSRFVVITIHVRCDRDIIALSLPYGIVCRYFIADLPR
jgi:hypothetical protein